MLIVHNVADSISSQLNRLKSMQNSCTQLLIECVEARASYPHMRARLDGVIARTERVMTQNAAAIARLEIEARMSRF